MQTSSLKDEIRGVGLRVTASRMAVLRLVRGAERPITHAEVAQALAEETWDRATLYRNLMDLSEAGLLRRVSLGAVWHFEAIGDQPAHPHFVCTECGGVSCTPAIEIPTQGARRSPKAMRKGEVEVQFHGVCDACG